MNFSQDTSEESTFIHSYTADYLVVNQTKYDCHCLIHHNGLIKSWSPREPLLPVASEFTELLKLQPEVVLLGTGKKLIFPPSELRRYFNEQKIGLEIMDTGAACRTYNILLSEGRNVAAAILLDQHY